MPYAEANGQRLGSSSFPARPTGVNVERPDELARLVLEFVAGAGDRESGRVGGSGDREGGRVGGA